MFEQVTVKTERPNVARRILARMAVTRQGKGPLFAVRRPKARSMKAVGSYAIGSFAMGALATAAIYVGTFAVGRLAVGRLAVRHGRIKRLRIDALEIGRLEFDSQTPMVATSHNGNKTVVEEEELASIF